MSTVKAAVWTGPSKIEVQDVEMPDVQDDGILLKVNAAGICGTDIHVYPLIPPYPAILCHEFTGTIVEMGKYANNVMNSFSGPLKVGDRISVYPWLTCGHCIKCLRFGPGSCSVCDDSFIYGLPYEVSGLVGKSPISSDVRVSPYLKGGFSEYIYIFPKTYVWKVPDDMPDQVAVLLDPMAVAMRGIELAMRVPGQLEDSFNTNSTVLILGDGQIGILTALLAKMMAIKNVVISGIYDECLAFAKEYSGADYVINSAEMSFEVRKQQIDEITSGIGADVVFGCIGTTKAFSDGIRLLKRAGTYIEIGNLVDPAPVEFDLSRDLCAKHATYIGMCINTPSAFNKAFTILLKHKNFNFQKIFTHHCGLEGLNEVLNQGKNRDYVKGLVEFKK